MPKTFNLNKFIKIFLNIIYPFVVYFGFNYLGLPQTSILILTLFGIKIAIMHDSTKPNLPIKQKYLFFILVVSTTILFYFKKFHLIQLYPIFLNLSLGIYFYQSTTNGSTPIVEKIAQLSEKNLSPEAKKYTRTVTKVWTIFFAFNALLSFCSFSYFNLKVWAIYNSFLSYVFAGIIFITEYCIRIKLRKNWQMKKKLNSQI